VLLLVILLVVVLVGGGCRLAVVASGNCCGGTAVDADEFRIAFQFVQRVSSTVHDAPTLPHRNRRSRINHRGTALCIGLFPDGNGEQPAEGSLSREPLPVLRERPGAREVAEDAFPQGEMTDAVRWLDAESLQVRFASFQIWMLPRTGETIRSVKAPTVVFPASLQRVREST
jgi:hypothetical protein